MIKSNILKKVISGILAVSAICTFNVTYCFAYEPSDPDEKTPETPYEGTFDINPHHERAYENFEYGDQDFGDYSEPPLELSQNI